MSSFLSTTELLSMGFASLGTHLQVSRNAQFYNISKISLGSYVRIDDFSILSAGAGGIYLGNFIHIAAHCFIAGQAPIIFEDFSSLSSHGSIYSSNDDYSGKALSNPTIPSKYTNVYSEPVTLDKHVIIGSHSVILPGTYLQMGCAVGAQSLVKGRTYPPNSILFGIPVTIRGHRNLDYLELEKQLYAEYLQ